MALVAALKSDLDLEDVPDLHTQLERWGCVHVVKHGHLSSSSLSHP